MNQDEYTANYCACFIDLLGQRDMYKSEGLLPKFETPEEKRVFIAKWKKTIGAIRELQKDADKFVEAMAYKNPELRKSLPREKRHIYDEMRRVEPKQQRWSDGLVYYVSLKRSERKCPMSDVFAIFALSGHLCFLGLAKRLPLRGAIDIAWGIELHENELYGAIVAKAYELESKIAQYPRIVVSPRTIEYLEVNSQMPTQDCFSQINKKLSFLCLDMVEQDIDGHYILHYLGEGFQRHVSKGQHSLLYKKALEFVSQEFSRHQKAKNTKLAFRYAILRDCFSRNDVNI